MYNWIACYLSLYTSEGHFMSTEFMKYVMSHKLEQTISRLNIICTVNSHLFLSKFWIKVKYWKRKPIHQAEFFPIDKLSQVESWHIAHLPVNQLFACLTTAAQKRFFKSQEMLH